MTPPNLDTLRTVVDAIARVPHGKRVRLSQELGISSMVCEDALAIARDLPGLLGEVRRQREAAYRDLQHARAHERQLLEEIARLERRLAAANQAVDALRRQLAGMREVC